jgi:putative heme-binding domain-containing protein
MSERHRNPHLAFAYWMPSSSGLIALSFACALVVGQDFIEVPPQPATTPADVLMGKRLFEIHCAYCHGKDGDGGRGPVLNKAKLRRAPDDTALFKVIRGGIPGSDMPPSDLSAHQTWQVAAFMRSLARVSHTKIAGDAKHGQVVYKSKGNCAACHTIAGRGGAVGPDLTQIGATKGIDYLRAALLDPEADVPDGFLQVRVVTKNGSHITGVRLNEDNFSIQVRDLGGGFHSFWKDELRELYKDPGKSPMPSYRQIFSQSELDDVLAYLESLQEAP